MTRPSTTASGTLTRAMAFVATFVLCAAAPAAAQTTASIRGTVTAAANKAPVSGARVAIDNPARLAITNERGQYVLRDVPSGTYTVTVTAVGREPWRQTVSVAAGQTQTLDFALKEGSLLLGSVIVSATRIPMEASKVASTVNVLTPEHIQTSPSRESQDLLREIPGVELPRQSSLVGGTAQIVSIRGVDEGRTAVLFDGIPVNDAWGEWIDWGRVPKSMLDRVEVIEGGTSNLYGNGAMGGVISFFSRPLAPGSGTITLDGGSRDARHVAAGIGLPVWGPLTANFSGDYQEGGGYNLINPDQRGTIDNPSEVIQRNAYGRLDYAPSARWNAFVNGHLFGDNRNLGTPLAFAARDQANIDLGLNYGEYATGNVGIRAWDGRQTEHQRGTVIRTGGRTTEDSNLVASIPSHDWGASAIWTRNGLFKLESFSVGGDYRHMQGAFDEIDYNSGACPGITCGQVVRTVWSGGDQSLSGVFAQAIAAPLAPLRVELSARGDWWSNDNGKSVDATAGTTTYANRSKSAFSPRLGIRYQIVPSLSAHGAVYEAFRAPNLAELYRKQISATSITLPNPDLASESAVGRELGLDWQPNGIVQLKGTWYVADYSDFNVPVTFPATNRPTACGAVATCRQRQNINSSRSQGGEAYVALRPIQALFVSASVNYDDARQQSGIADPSHKPHINRVPSPKQTIRATYSSQLLGAWTAVWRHEGHTTTLQGAWLDPFTVVDLNVQRDLVAGVRGFVAVDNVGDVKYQINLSSAAPNAIVSYGMPRTIRAGVQVSRF